jgi:hypothetical protein
MTKSSALAIGVMCFVTGVSAAAAQEPVTLTSTADFRIGNNEGLVSPAQDRVTRDQVSAGAVGDWSTLTAYPVPRGQTCSVAYNGFLYVVGGDAGPNYPGGRYRTDVHVAPLNANGTVGAWSATTGFATGRRLHTSIAYNGFLYVMGGINTGPNFLEDVQVARINANGTVGAWSSTTALPWARAGHNAVAYNGFLYLIGGSTSGGYPDTLVAAIRADGSLGAWSATTNLPSLRGAHSSVAHNGFLYVFGGNQFGPAGFARLDDVLVAPLAADGSVGAWSATTELPTATSTHTSVVDNGFVYVIGGDDGGGDMSDAVRVAPINADGSLGAWSTSTALPSPRKDVASAVYNGFVYTLGWFPDRVVVAPIAADSGNSNQAASRLNGVYSHLVDLQSDTSTRFITPEGVLSPGGVVRLQVRVAPAETKIFGPETVVESVTMGAAIEVPGSGRYVWIRLTLDDTGTSDAGQPTHVTDITVSPFGAPSAGVVFDGAGEDIDTQVSTTMIEANWSGFTPTEGDGISFYEWSIGTSPGSTDIQDWASVGSATSASNTALSLGSGMKFVNVRATSSAGLASPVATSDGVQVLAAEPQPPPSETPAPAAEDDEKKEWWRCSSSASAMPGSAVALLLALALLASAVPRRRS